MMMPTAKLEVLWLSTSITQRRLYETLIMRALADARPDEVGQLVARAGAEFWRRRQVLHLLPFYLSTCEVKKQLLYILLIICRA
jgi:hypothetical protein